MQTKMENKINTNTLTSVMKNWQSDMLHFGKEILRPGKDYGLINGFEKPVLLKPGAEKLCKAYDLQIKNLDCVNEVFKLEKPFIDVTYKCVLSSKDGLNLGVCEGNANSEEPKFKYVYSRTNYKPPKSEADKLKLEGKGRWLKSGSEWLWTEKRLNGEIIGQKNTIKKIAQKRAFVGAVLMATCTSEYFSQD